MATDKGVFLSISKIIIIVAITAVAIVIVGLSVGLATRKCRETIPEEVTTTKVTKPSTAATSSRTSPSASSSPGKTTTPHGSTLETTTPSPGTEPWHNPFLPPNVRPVHYDIRLFPDMTADIYYGQVSVLVNVLQPVEYIILHQQYVNITSTLLTEEDGTDVPVEEAFAYDKNQYWVVKPGSSTGNLTAASYWLSLNYTGDLMKNIVGIYKSIYTTNDGNNRQV